MRSRPSILRALALAATLVAGCAWAPGEAAGQQDWLVPQAVVPDSPNQAPPGFRLTPREAQAVADRLPEVRAERERVADLRAVTSVSLYLGDAKRYEVTYLAGDDIRVNIHVDGLTGRVLEAWTGPQADNLLARGYQPALGNSLNRPYVWLGLAALFLAPFIDPRRPLRLLHVDLLVLLAFGVSQLYFNQGRIEISVPLVYPLLVYLLARLLCAGFRPRQAREPLVPFARANWLALGLLLLVGFRIGLNVVDSTVIDVGYASVVGADRIAHGEELYVENEAHGDTYGPVNYLAYLPFEALLPTDGTWDSVPAAHAAAIVFDLVTIIGLLLLGSRLRTGGEGRRLGLALAYAWAAYPFTLLGLQTNTNDGLVAALLVASMLALRSPAGRGLMLGLATAAKLAPVVLVPLLAGGTGEAARRRSWPRFGAAFACVVVVSMFAFIPDGGLRELYDTTVGYQLGRESAFSLWGLHPSLSWLQDALLVAAGGLAVLMAFVPRRRDLRALAALGAAVLVAVQLPATHWFYFYLVWVAPPALVAMLGAYRWTDERERPGRLRDWFTEPMTGWKARGLGHPRRLATRPNQRHLKEGTHAAEAPRPNS